MPQPRHLLILRFSSLGDIAMTIPVIRNLLAQHPHLQVTFVSVPFVAPLFEGIERLHFYPVQLKGNHKGVPGLYRLSRELNQQIPFDAVADLHNVLRTKVLRVFLRSPHAVIDKGRKEKAELTRPQHKLLRPLKSTFQRYADVFSALGVAMELNREGGIKKIPLATETVSLKTEGYRLIGIAPFAQYTEKTYPLEKMKEVVRILGSQEGIKVLLFGSREDAAVLKQWESNDGKVSVIAGRFPFGEELKWIAGLDVMVSMDSANMHLASLYGVPVVSVWGGTHPWLGFYGWGQDEALAVQVDLDCGPSSVFGNKPCPRGDFACMNNISPLLIAERVQKLLSI